MEEEFSLLDVLQILWRRRRLVLLGTLLVTSVAFAVSLKLPSVYEVTTIIEPGVRPITDEKGQIIDEESVEAPEAIKDSILRGDYAEAIGKRFASSSAESSKIKVAVVRNTNLVKISIETTRPALAAEILQELVSLITADIERGFSTEAQQIQSQIKQAQSEEVAFRQRIQRKESQIVETSTRIDALERDWAHLAASPSADPVLRLLLATMIQDQQLHLDELVERLDVLKGSASELGMRLNGLKLKLLSLQGTKVKKIATVPATPVKPRKGLIVALAFLLSLLTTTMAAFLIESQQKTRTGQSSV